MRRSLVLLLGLLMAVLVSATAAFAQTPIFAVLGGPNAIGPTRVGTYDVAISGGPSGPVNYTVRWYLTGTGNLSRASPVQASPETLTQTTPIFRINVTAPEAEQTITLVVQATARSGSVTEETTVEKQIVVITGITLSATFRNDGSTAAVNVTAIFYVDDARVGTSSIARINPNAQATTTLEYLPVGLAVGTHRLRVEADLDGNGIIDAGRGETSLNEVFYKGTPGLSTGWTILIGIGVFVPVFLATVALRRRQRT